MKKSEVSKLQVGDILSETQYYIVKQADAFIDKQVKVRNERGFEFHISKDIVEEGVYSANQYQKEVKISKTDLALLMLNIGDTVFEASFQKQPSPQDISETIASLNAGKILSKSEMKAKIAAAYNGETRILRGYKIANEAHFGRIKVVDLEAPKDKGSNIRLIDLRSLNYLIYQNVKYIVK